MTSFISGQPLAITMSESPTINFTGGGDGSRPLMVANPNLPSGQRSVSQWYNVAAFAEPIADVAQRLQRGRVSAGQHRQYRRYAGDGHPRAGRQ